MAKKLSRDDILKLAKLSRLSLTEDEVHDFDVELNTILDFISALESAKVDNLLPTDQVNGLTNVLRDDCLIDYGYSTESLLENVSNLKDHYIKVPKMIGES